MTSLKRNFIKEFFDAFFLKFWWQTSNWCWWRYWKFCVDICCLFWAINKIRQGAESPPAPSEARVKSTVAEHQTTFNFAYYLNMFDRKTKTAEVWKTASTNHVSATEFCHCSLVEGTWRHMRWGHKGQVPATCWRLDATWQMRRIAPPSHPRDAIVHVLEANNFARRKPTQLNQAWSCTKWNGESNAVGCDASTRVAHCYFSMFFWFREPFS